MDIILNLYSKTFFFGMPIREQGVPRTSGAKTKQGEIL